MKDVANVERRQSIVRFNPKAGNARCTIAVLIRTAGGADTAKVQQIMSIGIDLGPGVRGKEVQTSCKVLFHFGLKAVIITAASSNGIAVALSEVGEGKEILCTESRWQFRRQQLRNDVRIWKHLQVAAQRGDVASLNR